METLIMSKIILIAARDWSRQVSINGKLPWSCNEDLQHFKEETKGSIVIMGRCTWESLPIKPLPNRLNIVITTNKQYNCSPALRVSSLDDAVLLAKWLAKEKGIEKIFIIGGAQVYEEALKHKMPDQLILTRIVVMQRALNIGDKVDYFPMIGSLTDDYEPVDVKQLGKTGHYVTVYNRIEK